MRFLLLLLVLLFSTSRVYGQEESGDAMGGDSALEEESVEVEETPEVDPEEAAKRAEKEAAAQQMQSFYVSYLTKKTSPSCKAELEAVLANPPEDATQSPFTEKCDKEIQSVRGCPFPPPRSLPPAHAHAPSYPTPLVAPKEVSSGVEKGEEPSDYP